MLGTQISRPKLRDWDTRGASVVIIPTASLIAIVLVRLISADTGPMRESASQGASGIRNGQKARFPLLPGMETPAVAAREQTPSKGSIRWDAPVSTIRIKSAMHGRVTLERNPGEERVLAHALEGIVHLTPISKDIGGWSLAVYIERMWEVSFIASAELSAMDLGRPEQPLFDIDRSPKHKGERRVSCEFAMSLFQDNPSVATCAAKHDAIDHGAQWYVAGLSGKTVHLTMQETDLTIEPRGCSLSPDESRWFYHSVLPELVGTQASRRWEATALVTSLKKIIPTKTILVHASQDARSNHQAALAEVCHDGGQASVTAWHDPNCLGPGRASQNPADSRIIHRTLDPRTFEARFPMRVFLHSPFVVHNAGPASLSYLHVDRTFGELRYKQRRGLSL